jgi:hypothetical protein
MSGSKPKAIGEILASPKESGELSEHFEHARIWERWPAVATPGPRWLLVYS